MNNSKKYELATNLIEQKSNNILCMHTQSEFLFYSQIL